MQKLGRSVRFSINPFLTTDEAGYNSFASKPCGEGLAIFFELFVGLVGEVEKKSGFVINVIDIDATVRKHVVPIFADRIRQRFKNGKHIGNWELAELLRESCKVLRGKFGGAMVSDLGLKLNPYRKLAIDCEDIKMIYFSEKFEFAAMHKLWNNEFSAEKNFEVFGKCANPTGHGHNYILEVTVKAKEGSGDLEMGTFEKTVEDEFLNLVDHKNINADVSYFDKEIPTVENISRFAWEKLAGKFGNAKLHSVTIWETDKTSSTFYG